MYSFESREGVFKLFYDWFAGWRWELWRDGAFIDECLGSFDAMEECASDASSRVALTTLPVAA